MSPRSLARAINLQRLDRLAGEFICSLVLRMTGVAL
jgi:hypothetical protein